MGASVGGIADRILARFRRLKVLTLMEVALLIGTTVHTARRRLKQWKAFSSYNKNGRYYALPDVPTFDANGLWRWRGVFFSRYRTLKNTVVELVTRSEAGLNAIEMRELLGLDPRSFLSVFARHPQLKREKIQSRFVYFSANPQIYAQQRQRRSAMTQSTRLPSEAEAIAILVEYIKHPTLSIEALSNRLKKKALQIEPEVIQNLFARHGLNVKKTPASR